ncbi:MAG: queuosine precursor transporter [Flavobacteriales bacterium]|nr:queuosine precursor transporter [Flavobacteriales bacterium]
MESKKSRLFVVLGGIFIANALLAEFIGGKIFNLEKSLGFSPLNFHILGNHFDGFNMTAGVLLWPVVFILTDIINEYFGKKGVRFLSYFAVGLISYSFLMIYLSIGLKPSDWFVSSRATDGIADMNLAFSFVFGQGLWIIAGSLVAFLVGQLADVTVFQMLKNITGNKKLWLRATGSTLVSQLIDSFIVLFIAFHLSGKMTLNQVTAIAIVNYIYKFVVAIALTPVLYLLHGWIDGYLENE